MTRESSSFGDLVFVLLLQTYADVVDPFVAHKMLWLHLQAYAIATCPDGHHFSGPPAHGLTMSHPQASTFPRGKGEVGRSRHVVLQDVNSEYSGTTWEVFENDSIGI
jgi:hypothetical protein